MEILFHSILNKKTYKIVKYLGNGYNEIIIDIKIGDVVFNSIELKNGKIYLNRFSDDLEFKNTIDDLELIDKMNIYKILYDTKKGYKKKGD